MKGTTVRQYAASSPETAASGLLCAAADGYDAVLLHVMKSASQIIMQ